MRAVCVALLLSASIAAAQEQDLGHRLPSGLGMDAGTQPDRGLYLGDRFVWFASHVVHDRAGNVVPIDNLDIDGYGNAFGVAGTAQIGGLYVTAAVAVPIVKLALSSDDP